MQTGKISVRSVRRMRALALLAFAVPALAAGAAGGAQTIGQLAPGAPPSAGCINPAQFDIFQRAVASGTPYVVPATGGVRDWTVSSWSHNAGAGAGQTLSLKFFRRVAGDVYSVTAIDGPRAILPARVNTFSGLALRVRAGDLLGLNDGVVPTACTTFTVPGDVIEEFEGNLPVGGSGEFDDTGGSRVNVSAVISPTNTFSLGEVDRNKRKGTATLTIDGIPNPGELTLSGKGLKTRAIPVTAPGAAELKLKAKGRKRERLNDNGRVKVKPEISFTPSGGDPNVQSIALKLRKRR